MLMVLFVLIAALYEHRLILSNNITDANCFNRTVTNPTV